MPTIHRASHVGVGDPIGAYIAGAPQVSCRRQISSRSVNLPRLIVPVMADLIPFPLHSRAALVRSIADDLETVHGPAADVFWRQRIAGIVADLRADGLADAAIRTEILGLQGTVQVEMQRRDQRSTALHVIQLCAKKMLEKQHFD